MTILKVRLMFTLGIYCTISAVTGTTEVPWCSRCAEVSVNTTYLACNETTGKCLYGCGGNYDGEKCDTCKRGFTGGQCQIPCDYNCLVCTTDKIARGVGCELCYKEYYYFNKRCEACSAQCQRNTTSESPTCNQIDGSCEFGCIKGYYGALCNKECSALCIDGDCGSDGCCTQGCRFDRYGGCRCDEECSNNCFDSICHQNKTCKLNCVGNKWGPACSQSCSENCKEAHDNSSSCDKAGICIFGCKESFQGPSCSERCSETCLGRKCDAKSGICLQGCTMGYHGAICDVKCGSKCLDSDCFYNNGTCKKGCVPGFYGPFCLNICSEYCVDILCSRENGTCTHGCVEGFTGENCQKKLYPPLTARVTDYMYISMSSGLFVLSLITLVVILCLIWRADRIEKRETGKLMSN